MSGDFPLRPYPWQHEPWSALLGRVHQSRLAHALLLSGPQGLGKRHLALSFAHYLLCETPTEEGACGRCRGCRLFEAGSHPDFLLVEPEEEGKELTVGQIRSLAAYQALKPQFSAHKVVLLAPAERMNTNASNALLKTLEEPTPGTLLLLVTDRPTGLLPTIRSRCQTLALSPAVADEATLAWLKERTGFTFQAVKALFELSGNAPLRALQLAQEGAEVRETVWQGLAAAAKGEASASEVAAQWQEIGPDKAFGWAYAALCDLVRFRSTDEAGILGGSEGVARLQALAKPLDLKALFRLLDRAQEAFRLLRGHANAQLLIEEFLIHWISLFPRRPQTR